MPFSWPWLLAFRLSPPLRVMKLKFKSFSAFALLIPKQDVILNLTQSWISLRLQLKLFCFYWNIIVYVWKEKAISSRNAIFTFQSLDMLFEICHFFKDVMRITFWLSFLFINLISFLCFVLFTAAIANHYM